MGVFYRSVQGGGNELEMASKSDSPNMVAHPEFYVKFDVIFWEGAAWSHQALSLPFSRASGAPPSRYKPIIERGRLSLSVGNLRTRRAVP